MDLESLFVSLNGTLVAAAAVGGWLRVRGLATSKAGTGETGDGRHREVHPLTLAEMLWMLCLMLAFYWFGRELGYLLLEIG